VKVVLRQDVDNLGERGDVVNVAPGYARNYLLPKGIALEATPGNLKSIEMRRKVWDAREAKEVEEAKAFAEKLAGVELSIAKKAGESETLYGSVTTSEIAELLDAKGFEVDRRKIVVDEPIKSLGEFNVHVKLHKQVTGEVKLVVTAETE
jgi:large subunit ribosomal protein L9